MLHWIAIIRCNIVLYVLGILQVLQNVVENILDSAEPDIDSHVSDLSGKFALITGANRGLGRCIALELCRRGCNVVIACRNITEGDAVALQAANLEPSPSVNKLGTCKVIHLDLMSSKSVISCVEEMRDVEIDFVICNAGIMAPKHLITTTSGMESQLQTNVLGHDLLVHLLLSQNSIRNENSSRIVFVSSFAHIGAPSPSLGFIQETLKCPQQYHPKLQYCVTKRFDLLLAKAYHMCMKNEYSSNAASYSLNPGVVDTKLCRSFCENEVNWLGPFSHAAKGLLAILFPFTLRKPEKAASLIIRSLNMPSDSIGGKYLSLGPMNAIKQQDYPWPSSELVQYLFWRLSQLRQIDAK